MPPLIREVVLVCIGFFFVISIVAAIRLHRNRGWFWTELALALIVAIVVLLVPSEIVYGDNHFIQIISVMLVSIVLGMIANYLFNYTRGSFDLVSFIKPLCVSPIVLLPLIGSIDQTGTLSPLQTVSVLILAFQNGFFWKSVFDRVQAGLNEGNAAGE